METTTDVAIAGMRLGKLPPKFDPRTLRAADYLKPRSLPKIPKVIDRLKRVPTYPVLANNRLGDCTCAAIDHIDLCSEAWGNRTGEAEAEREARTIRRYSRVSGYDPNTGANDNGAFLLDVLKDAQTNGLDGNGGEKIGPYIAVDPLNESQMVACLYLFGVLYTGVWLPVSAQPETGTVWKTTTGPGSEPGSWGGHAIYTGRITAKERSCVTWGRVQRMTAAWQARYMDEAWTFIDEDFIRDNTKKTVSGFDLAGLMADIEALRKP